MAADARPMTLLEREPALEALVAALGEAARGEGRVALVYGEAGIGKTTLVDHFSRAHAGTPPARILWGACGSLHTPPPPRPRDRLAPHAGPEPPHHPHRAVAPRARFSPVPRGLRAAPPPLPVPRG